MSSPTAQFIPPARRVAARSFWRRYSMLTLSVVLLIGGLALRLYRLDAQSLWLDEGGTWAEVTGQTWSKLVADLASANAAYPLYHLLLKGWVALAGDSEWALRFPSALSGALAVVVLFWAGAELEHQRSAADSLSHRPGRASPLLFRPVLAAVLFALAPFALWHAQDAKVYSLLLLWAATLLWALLRALRTRSAYGWLAVLAVGLVGVFIHRLAILGLVGALLAVVLLWPVGRGAPAMQRLLRGAALLGALLGALAAIYGVIRAVGVESRGGSGHIPAGPLAGLWLALAHFALDRGNIGGWLGAPLWLWALPALGLTAWGMVRLGRDAWQRRPAAIAIVCLFAVPLLLFAVALGFVRLFESRYVTVAFPAWILMLVYPLQTRRHGDAEIRRHGDKETDGSRLRPFIPHPSSFLLVLLVLVDIAVLLQPQHGLFSGAPVKEQWRDGVAEIARRAQPDDLLIVHPYYVQPMWAYYAPRVTPDPLPQPVTFDVLGQGYCLAEARSNPRTIPLECYRRVYEQEFNRVAQGRKRMLMLLAPDHARTIDPPFTAAELQAKGLPATASDKYGLLGLRFQYASEQHTWPCGDTGDALIGIEVMCASFPSFYRQTGAAAIPQPAVKLEAVFGGELELRGYTISPAGGKLRPGGTLPITLFWSAAVEDPAHNYTMFLHLCHNCDLPPLAQFDRPPLDGFFPAGQTSTWRLGDPVHDERAIPLVDPSGAPLAPGRYTLLLGVYPAGLAAPQLTDRLVVTSSGAEVRGGTRLVLGQVTIGQ